MNHKNHSLNNIPDISTKYALPQYYIPTPAFLQTLAHVFIFSDTSFETAKGIIDSIVASRDTIKTVRTYTVTGVHSDVIAKLQTYFQKHLNLDSETIEVFDDEALALLQLIFKRSSVYREALQN